MPKEITHWTLAETAFRRMRDASPLKRIIESHKNLYFCGAVILDSPFYVQWGKGAAGIRDRAERIHDTAQNAFECFLPILKNPDFLSMESVVSLLAGITTHIFSDAAFHPFICHFSGTTRTPDKNLRRKAQTRHHTLETYLDFFFAARGIFSTNTTFGRFFNAVEISRSAFMELLSRIYGTGRTVDRVMAKKSVYMHAVLQALFDQKTLKGMLDALNLLPGINLDTTLASFYPCRKPRSEALFSRPLSYRHPVTGEARYVPVQVLEREALASIQNVFSAIEPWVLLKPPGQGLEDLHGPNLYTGMTGYRLADMQYFNNAIDLMSLIKG